MRLIIRRTVVRDTNQIARILFNNKVDVSLSKHQEKDKVFRCSLLRTRQGATIRNNPVTSVVSASSNARKSLANQLDQQAKRYRSNFRRNVKFTVLGALLISIGTTQLMGRVSSSNTYVAPQARLENPIAAPDAQPVDEVIAAEVAANAAVEANILITSNVTNRADTLDAQVKLATKTEQSTTAAVEKPQIVSPASAAGATIQTITAKKGDTVVSLAKEYGISEDTIKWANNISSNTLAEGAKVIILPVSGVLYTVESGDTVENLASTYKSTAEQIRAYNDVEVKGLKPGTKIVIPNGVKPAEAPAASASTTANSSFSSAPSFSFGSGGTEFSGNRYAFGYCTYYVYNKRAAAGRPIGSNWGNATTWAALARASGFRVDNSPAAGAIIQNSGGWGGYGHVGYVERVNADGSLLVSDMNYAGWNVVSSRTVSASQARSYQYIH